MIKTYFKIGKPNAFDMGYEEKPEEYTSYEEAYDAMCERYITEKRAGSNPGKLVVLKHTISKYNGAENHFTAPVWG